MNILIIGSGYVGLITGVCFAEMGNRVICLDIDKEKIKKLKKGQSTIYEPGLGEMLQRNIEAKRIFFDHDYKKSVLRSDILFFALPTPSNDDGSCNTSFLKIRD